MKLIKLVLVQLICVLVCSCASPPNQDTNLVTEFNLSKKEQPYFDNFFVKKDQDISQCNQISIGEITAALDNSYYALSYEQWPRSDRERLMGKWEELFKESLAEQLTSNGIELADAAHSCLKITVDIYGLLFVGNVKDSATVHRRNNTGIELPVQEGRLRVKITEVRSGDVVALILDSNRLSSPFEGSLSFRQDVNSARKLVTEWTQKIAAVVK